MCGPVPTFKMPSDRSISDDDLMREKEHAAIKVAKLIAARLGNGPTPDEVKMLVAKDWHKLSTAAHALHRATVELRERGYAE